MPTITPTFATISGDAERNGIIVTWADMANGDVGAPTKFTQFADRSMQVEGTFGAGGSVAAEGSNDGSNYRALTDPQGVTIAVTANGIKAITEAVVNIRPHVTAGDGTTSVTVTMYLRRTQFP